MVKHNSVIADNHFRKDWQRYVKTWFDQPAKKKARRVARATKAAKLNPRPVSILRPVVHGTTVKYNSRNRLGRGFTIEELKAAGIPKKTAHSIGVSVDHRRKNRSEEAFQVNVNRLKLYKSKLVIFPRKNAAKRLKKGDSSLEERKAVAQVTAKTVIPMPKPAGREKARVITKEERQRTVAGLIRKTLVDSKRFGVREKRAKEKAAGKAKQKGDDAEETAD